MRESGSTDGERIMEIRRRAVDVAHDFLSPEDHRDIEKEVAALVDPDFRGSGIGRAFVGEALLRHPDLSTEVNEQCLQAIGFYERVGFERSTLNRCLPTRHR
jgi:putative acetyltransferase